MKYPTGLPHITHGANDAPVYDDKEEG